MASFVLVHGAWGGGWEWREVERLLRERGHEATRPTLTGLGERTHLSSPAVTLATHVEDVVRHVEFEGLSDAVLCGHSYGGMVVTGAADRLAHRLRRIVYIDAFVPRDGESVFDLLPPEWTSMLRASVADGAMRLPFPLEEIAATHGASYAARTVGQPVGTFEQPVRVGPGAETVPCSYIRCMRSDAPVEPSAARARAAGWPYLELAAGHDAQVEDPSGLTELLIAAS
jgi:pimeloyl-ACP methyl ester carboxylesterase